MAFNYDKVLAHIHKELGENTTFYISREKDTKLDLSIDDLVKWILTNSRNRWTRAVRYDGKLVNQCSPGRLRSLGDIYKIAKHYKPEVTLQQVREAILRQNVYMHYCGTVRKRVFRLLDPEFEPYGIQYGYDEFGEDTTKEEMLAIKNAARTQSEYLRRMSKVN